VGDNLERHWSPKWGQYQGEIVGKGADEHMENLKPCPWCGKTDKLEVMRPMQVAASNYLAIRCHRCAIWGPIGKGASKPIGHRGPWVTTDLAESAVESWNRRQAEPVNIPSLAYQIADATPKGATPQRALTIRQMLEKALGHRT
jgi:Lar family restriction alleviation protein